MDRKLRHDCDGRCHSRQQHERDLLDVDPTRGLAPPPYGPAEASERIDVQDHQHDREIHGHRFGQQRAGEQGHGAPIPPSAALLSVASPEVSKDRRQVEEPREDIPPFRGPGDGFHAQGMDRKHESGKRGRHSERVTAFRGTGQSPCQKPTGYEEEDHRIRGVQEEIGQVVAAGVHAPEQVIQPEGHPRQRNVVTQLRGSPHPAEVGPAKPPVVRVLEEILVVVPVHKLVVERWQERGEGDDSDHHRDKPGAPSLGGSAGNQFTRQAGRFQGAGLGGGVCLARLALASHWCSPQSNVSLTVRVSTLLRTRHGCVPAVAEFSRMNQRRWKSLGIVVDDK